MRDALTVGPRLDAISRLLDLTAIRSEFVRFTEIIAKQREIDETPLVTYRATPFGKALFEYLLETMGATLPTVRTSYSL